MIFLKKLLYYIICYDREVTLLMFAVKFCSHGKFGHVNENGSDENRAWSHGVSRQ